MVQVSQGLSYKISSTTLRKFFAFGLFFVSFRMSLITNQQLVAMLQGHLRFVFTYGHVTQLNLLNSTLLNGSEAYMLIRHVAQLNLLNSTPLSSSEVCLIH